MLQLLKKPAAYFKVQQEVDEVLGQGKITVNQLKDLKYVDAVLRETLRLTPTAPAFSRSIRDDNPNDVEELLGGQYAIRRDDKILCLITKTQRDPKVYGEDANEFRPERMLEENFQRLPKAAWKPFGNGLRSCIVSKLLGIIRPFRHTLKLFPTLSGESFCVARSPNGFGHDLPKLQYFSGRPRVPNEGQTVVDH